VKCGGEAIKRKNINHHHLMKWRRYW
jgi:hypothetical protein